MKKLRGVFFLFSFLIRLQVYAGIKLTALTHPGDPTVTLQWNMVSYPGTTAYSLFKSMDGVVWEVAAANPVSRNYTSSTILAYRDNFSGEQKLYYRVKVYDTNENIVDMSNITVVANPKNNYPVEKPQPLNKPSQLYNPATRNAWQIFPNPVNEMLNLAYRGKDVIKGVINIVIQDASGKVVVHFRAASTNKQLNIPVNTLHSGIYFIKINVANEVQMEEKFIKK